MSSVSALPDTPLADVPEAAAPPSLRERTTKALKWRFASGLTKILLQTAVQVVLARLLPVKDFGLLAQAMIITNFATVVSEIGMAPALIQKRNLTEEHVHAGFTISVLSGIVLTVLLWVGAPLAEYFFPTPGVTAVLRALSFTFLFSSLATAGGALLQRDLDFRKLFFIDTGSYALGYAVVGITMALGGWGVWALVWASIAQTILKAVLTFALARRVLHLRLPREEARSLLSFGAGMSATKLVLYLARNGDNIVVGRYLGAAALGLYGRAYTLMSMPISEFSGALNTVLFSAYAEIQDQPERLRRVYLNNLGIVALRVFPVLTAMAAVAPEIMRGVYGAKWDAAGGPFRILCIAGCFLCVHNLGDAVARARGAIADCFWRHSIYLVGIFLFARLGSQYGLDGVALGVGTALVLQYLLMAQLSIRLVATTWREFFVTQAPGTLVAAVTGGATYAVAALLHMLSLPDLAIAVTATVFAAITALVVMLLLPRTWLPPMIVGSLEKIGGKIPVLSRLVRA